VQLPCPAICTTCFIVYLFKGKQYGKWRRKDQQPRSEKPGTIWKCKEKLWTDETQTYQWNSRGKMYRNSEIHL